MSSRWTMCMANCAILLVGCAENAATQSFSEIQSQTQRRLSREIQWIRDTQTEQRVAEKLHELLSSDLTADTAVQIALLNNRHLQATYSEVGIAAAQVVEAWLIENPVLTGQIRLLHSRPIWEIDVVQNFLDVLLLPLAVSVSQAELESTKLRVAGEVIGVASETLRTFYRYQARLQMLHYWQGVMLSAESAFAMAIRLREAGNITELRLARERTVYEQLRLDVAEVEMAAVQDRERLNMLMGLWGAATRWKAQPELPELPAEAPHCEDVEKRAIESSLELKAAVYYISAESQRLGLNSIRAVVPRLGIGAAVESDRPTEYQLEKHHVNGQTDYGLGKKTVEEWQAGPLLEFPLPIWNFGQAAYTTAEMEMLRRWHEYTAMAIDIRATARASEYRLRTAHQRALLVRHSLLPAFDDVFEQTHLQYNAMFLGVFDLLRAKEDQLRGQQRYIEALAEYWDARSNLDELLLGSARAAAQREQPGKSSSGTLGFMQTTLSIAGSPQDSGSRSNQNK